MNRPDLYASAFLTALAAAAAVGAYRLGVGDIHTPGSGFMPLATAAGADQRVVDDQGPHHRPRLPPGRPGLGHPRPGGGAPGPQAPLAGRIEHMLRSVWFHLVGGGAPDIQRNIIAQRGLGLPRE